MRAPKLKICGMKDMENILEVSAAAPDYMGFIFYKASPRYVGDDFEIPQGVDSRIKRVGVFVNESTEVIIQLVKKHQLDTVQLHGEEPPSQCQTLKALGVEVIKVFSIDSQFDFSSLIPYETVVDYFLFDTRGKLRGGNGIPFDWRMIDGYKGHVPFFLSGGIDSENVTEVKKLKHKQLFAIDVNSGIEDRPGIKNKEKLNVLLMELNTQ
jgi:phosphoribosylanthranilate isomerase